MIAGRDGLNGINFVIEEIDPIGHGTLSGPHIKEASTDGKVTGTGNLGKATVARLHQTSGKIPALPAIPHPENHTVVPIHFLTDRLQHCLHRSDHRFQLTRLERSQCFKAVAEGIEVRLRVLFKETFPHRKVSDGLSGKGGDVLSQLLGGIGAGGQDQKGATLILGEGGQQQTDGPFRTAADMHHRFIPETGTDLPQDR